jgi:hypothetical protein
VIGTFAPPPHGSSIPRSRACSWPLQRYWSRSPTSHRPHVSLSTGFPRGLRFLGNPPAVPYPVDTCSPAPQPPGSTTRGDSVPHFRVSLNVGPHSSPGFSGVYPGRLQTRPARILAILAVADNPRRLLPRHDDSTMGAAAACPYSALLGGIPGRIPSDRHVLPLLGLRLSRYPGEYAISPTPGRQEFHLHGDEVIKDPLILAPYPLQSCDRSFRETDCTCRPWLRLSKNPKT